MPLFENFTTENGLASNVVYEVFQDSKKRMWFATDKGISIYDGITWNNLNKSNGISDNEVYQIREDKQGRIWLLTDNGIPTIMQNDQIITGHYNWNETYTAKGHLYAFHEDTAGHIWIGSERQGLFKISNEGQVKHIPFSNLSKQALTTDIINYEGELLVVTLYGFNTIENDSIRTAHEDSQLYSTPRGLQVGRNYYAISEDEVYQYDLSAYSTPQDTLQFPSNVINLVEKSDNELWVATRNGIYVLNLNTKKITAHYLNGLSVSSVCTDHQNGLWITTLTQGVFYTSSLSAGIVPSNGGMKGEIYNVHRCDSTVWIGGIEGNFGYLNHAQKIKSLKWEDHQGEGLLSTVKSIQNDTYCTVPYLLNISQKPYEHYGITANEVIALDSGLFFCNASAIYFYPWDKIEQFKRNTPDAFILQKQERIQQIIIDTPGKSAILVNDTIWIGTSKGLITYPTSKTTLPNCAIMDLHIHQPNDIWISTHGEGLYRLYNHQLSKVNCENKDLSFCKKITNGKPGEVWVNTANKLFLFTIDSSNYSGREILFKSPKINAQINDFEYFRDTLYLASKNGLIQLPVDHSLNYNERIVSNKPLLYFDHEPVNTGSKIYFPQKMTEITLKLFSPSYFAHQQFVYRLSNRKNKSANWVKISGNELYFPSLPVGNNHIEIKCLYENGTQSDTFDLFVVVSLPFWMHPLFWIISILSIIVVIAFLIRFDILSKQKLQRIRNHLLMKLMKKDFIFVKNIKDGVEIKIDVSEIVYLKSSNNYVDIYLKNSTNIVVRTTLKKMQKRLSDYNYHYRIHKSYIVNISCVTGISKKSVTINDTQLPVGRTYRVQWDKMQKEWLKRNH